MTRLTPGGALGDAVTLSAARLIASHVIAHALEDDMSAWGDVPKRCAGEPWRIVWATKGVPKTIVEVAWPRWVMP